VGKPTYNTSCSTTNCHCFLSLGQDESRVVEKWGCGRNETVLDNHVNQYSRYGQLQQAFISDDDKNALNQLKQSTA
jgi:hypothetical protein